MAAEVTPQPSRLTRLAFAVDSVYHELDQARTAAVAAKPTLTCFAGCGACCERQSIEASVLEMLPMAAALLAAGVSEVSAPSPRSACPNYEPGEVAGRGKCKNYETRPLLCRAFGQSVRRSAHGTIDLISCNELKAGAPADVSGLPAVQDFQLQLWSLSPELANDRRPISDALTQAIAMLQLEREYS